jgi:hypothetical protein
MIDDAINKLTEADGIWLLGNSTLAAGINEDIVSVKVGAENAIVELGSATLEVTIRLADIALEASDKPPKKIILFVTKDDMNKLGSRASSSASYLEAMDSPSLYEKLATMIPIYSCRYSIRDHLRKTISDDAIGLLKSLKPAHAADESGVVKAAYMPLSDVEDSTYLYKLGKNYTPFDLEFSRIADAARLKGSKSISSRRLFHRL